eukprot:TRINITY_DN25832_c0_g1_i2.p1 TRINITY_DN25832_c0_g1~~TRINITY_DN25832_c0_g1_i2.p1  ORF type:complete len:180 (-),score=19.38 TRINITY_DN25832_c0_g1_i2:27-566(-)
MGVNVKLSLAGQSVMEKSFADGSTLFDVKAHLAEVCNRPMKSMQFMQAGQVLFRDADSVQYHTADGMTLDLPVTCRPTVKVSFLFKHKHLLVAMQLASDDFFSGRAEWLLLCSNWYCNQCWPEPVIQPRDCAVSGGLSWSTGELWPCAQRINYPQLDRERCRNREETDSNISCIATDMF